MLVVDDEADMRHLVTRLLRGGGYEAVHARHGAQALEMIGDARPLLVITDRMMPVLGGDELIRRLRSDERTSSIPIVMLTGSLADNPGADVVLIKPVERDALLAVVESLIGKADAWNASAPVS